MPQYQTAFRNAVSQLADVYRYRVERTGQPLTDAERSHIFDLAHKSALAATLGKTTTKGAMATPKALPMAAKAAYAATRAPQYGVGRWAPQQITGLGILPVTPLPPSKYSAQAKKRRAMQERYRARMRILSPELRAKLHAQEMAQKRAEMEQERLGLPLVEEWMKPLLPSLEVGQPWAKAPMVTPSGQLWTKMLPYQKNILEIYKQWSELPERKRRTPAVGKYLKDLLPQQKTLEDVLYPMTLYKPRIPRQARFSAWRKRG